MGLLRRRGRGTGRANIFTNYYSGDFPSASSWISTTIGSPSGAFDAGQYGGTFGQDVTGDGFGSTADQGGFVYQSINSTNVEFKLRVETPTGTSNTVGIMVREGLDANARTAWAYISTSGNRFGLHRTSSGEAGSTFSGADALSPGWLRIVRSSNTIAVYESEAGSSWVAISSGTFDSLSDTLCYGMFSASGIDGTQAKALFRQVTLNATPVTESSVTPIAFPGAEGPGAVTRHAYTNSTSPTVYHVTSTSGSTGAGTFRTAVESSGARIILFDISGRITLSSRLTMTHGECLIAGESAPGPVVLTNSNFTFSGVKDVCVRHLASRPGHGTGYSTGNRDAWEVLGDSQFLMFDHCSGSWGIDELVSLYPIGGKSPQDVTFQDCLFGEQLRRGDNTIRSILVGDEAKRIAFIRCALVHTGDRNPFVKGGAECLGVNNLIYNWLEPANFTGSGTALPYKVSWVGNHYIRGPSTEVGTGQLFGYRSHANAIEGSILYRDDNLVTGSSVTEYRHDSSFDPLSTTSPLSLENISILGSTAVQSQVLTNSGSRPNDRDHVDARIFDPSTGEVVMLSGGFQSSQATYGTFTVSTRTYPDEGSSAHTVVSTSGYTILEEALHASHSSLIP